MTAAVQAYSFLEHQLLESVKSSLSFELYANAAFLCERLYAEVKSEDVKLMLAECYIGKLFCTDEFRRGKTL